MEASCPGLLRPPKGSRGQATTTLDSQAYVFARGLCFQKGNAASKLPWHSWMTSVFRGSLDIHLLDSHLFFMGVCGKLTLVTVHDICDAATGSTATAVLTLFAALHIYKVMMTLFNKFCVQLIWQPAEIGLTPYKVR